MYYSSFVITGLLVITALPQVHVAQRLCLREDIRFRGHAGFVSCVRFLDDINVASSSNDGTIRVWDVSLRAVSRTIEMPAQRLRGRHGDGPRTVRQFDVRDNGAAIAELVHEDADRIRLWSRNGEFSGHVLREGEILSAVSFCKHGREVAIGRLAAGGQAWVELCDFQTGTRTWDVRAHADAIVGLAAHDAAKSLLASASANEIKVWDVEQKTVRCRIVLESVRISCLAFNCDGSRVLFGASDGRIRVADSRSGECLRNVVVSDGEVLAVAVDPRNRFIACGLDNGTVGLLDAVSYQLKTRVDAHKGPAYTVAFAPTVNLLASGGQDGEVRLWRIVDEIQGK